LLSAALAYYALFALGPLLLLSVTVAGFFLGEQRAGLQFSETLERYFGPELAGYLQAVLVSGAGNRYAVTATVVGVVFLVYGSLRLFLRLQDAFNLMWGVRVKRGVERRQLLATRTLLLVAAFVPAAVLVASFVLGSVLAWLEGPFGLEAGLATSLAERGMPALITWGALMALFRLLPDAVLGWADVWLGSLLTALGVLIGTNLFGVYLTWGGSATFYGAAGAILALLLWTHYMAVIIIAGVKLTRVLYESRGKQVRPARYAQSVREVAGGPSGERLSS
jgi:membrane protein